MTKTKGKLISDGGEGYIYEVQDDPYQLMKIFKETDLSGAPIVTDDLNAKLEYMVKNPPEVLISKGAVAWPLELISQNGKLSGFIMPKLNVDEHIQRTYSYRHPKLEASEYAKFPSVKSRIKIAINLCSAIDELHRKGYVFGDFNHHNIGVNYSTGQVMFMDCDSFHITDDSGKVHRTNVIMPGYLAPEIIAHCNTERAAGHDYDLDKVALPTFTRESDLFCLAVHIFKLLMDGVVPFRGVKYDSVGSNASPFMGNEAIERDSYVFKPGNKPSAVFCPTAKSLPPDILDLFNRTFIDGRNDPSIRTNAADWYITLNRFLNNELTQCSANDKHYHYKFLESCPYCEADDRHLTENGANVEIESNTAPSKEDKKDNSSSADISASSITGLSPSFSCIKPNRKIIGLTLLLTAGLISIQFLRGYNFYMMTTLIPITALYCYAMICVYIVCKKEAKNILLLVILEVVLVLEAGLRLLSGFMTGFFGGVWITSASWFINFVVYTISILVVVFSILNIVLHKARTNNPSQLSKNNLPRLAKGWIPIIFIIFMYFAGLVTRTWY